MFRTKNKVRLHDTDMAGVLYFPRQFRFVQEALEDFWEGGQGSLRELISQEQFLLLIVHCEADYFHPLQFGDEVEVQLTVEHVGNSSFSLAYEIYRQPTERVGRAKTVHVTVDVLSRKKISLPIWLANWLKMQKKEIVL